MWRFEQNEPILTNPAIQLNHLVDLTGASMISSHCQSWTYNLVRSMFGVLLIDLLSNNLSWAPL